MIFTAEVSPTVLTVPIAYPVLSKKLTFPVTLPAKVVIALFNVPKAKLPAPNNSSPGAVMIPLWVTAAPAFRVKLPVAVVVPIRKPFTSFKEIVEPVALRAERLLKSFPAKVERLIVFAPAVKVVEPSTKMFPD